jgi:hypothetical protein
MGENICFSKILEYVGILREGCFGGHNRAKVSEIFQKKKRDNHKKLTNLSICYWKSIHRSDNGKLNVRPRPHIPEATSLDKKDLC